METRAQQAVLIDLSTNTVLWEKNADQAMYPSSMSKLMTAYVALRTVSKGQIRLETPIVASAVAATASYAVPAGQAVRWPLPGHQ
jgi:D-alanyl-D-alanine carboxypeptidase (penicillin-binding protein 5/6)